jgi:hypothetical protein
LRKNFSEDILSKEVRKMDIGNEYEGKTVLGMGNGEGGGSK